MSPAQTDVIAGSDTLAWSRSTSPYEEAAGEGTGLGLAISRDIVLKHEGPISVHSEPGKFTEFVVTLPIAPAPVGASA